MRKDSNTPKAASGIAARDEVKRDDWFTTLLPSAGPLAVVVAGMTMESLSHKPHDPRFMIYLLVVSWLGARLIVWRYNHNLHIRFACPHCATYLSSKLPWTCDCAH